MSSGDHKTRLARAAIEFAIWRVGHAVDWECGAGFIARKVGCTARHVRHVCERRGWPVVIPGRRGPSTKVRTANRLAESLLAGPMDGVVEVDMAIA